MWWYHYTRKIYFNSGALHHKLKVPFVSILELNYFQHDVKFLVRLGVRVGEHNINTPEDCEVQDGDTICAPPYKDLAIEAIIPHPQHNATAFINDIGLLRIARINFSLGKAITFITLVKKPIISDQLQKI